MDVPGALRIRDAFFLPRAIISNAESTATSEKERERQAVDGPRGDLQEHYIFSAIECTSSSKARLSYGSQESNKFVYPHRSSSLFYFILPLLDLEYVH